MLDRLNEINKIVIKDVNGASFKKYGRIVDEYDTEELLTFLDKNTEIPEKKNVYVASDKGMEELSIKNELEKGFYGNMEIEIGYCNGRNSSLNGLEYHKGSELDLPCTDMVLLLGNIWDIENNKYDSSNVEAFFIPKGTMVELYGTTLHFSPCKVNEEGFKCAIILPGGTNTPLDKQDRKNGEEQLLFMKNKWLLAHPERDALVKKGAYPGIYGENLTILY